VDPGAVWGGAWGQSRDACIRWAVIVVGKGAVRHVPNAEFIQPPLRNESENIVLSELVGMFGMRTKENLFKQKLE